MFFDVIIIGKGPAGISASLYTTRGKLKTLIIGKESALIKGKGVHYCAACDGFFYTEMKIGILGYKDYAVHELREFEGITDDITLYTNGHDLEINDDSQKYLNQKQVRVKSDSIQSFEGEEFLDKIIFKNGTEENINGLFVAYGSASSIDFARKLGINIENNNIVVDEYQKTNIGGVFAAGDCTGVFAQVATVVGQGAIAGKEVKSYIKSLN